MLCHLRALNQLYVKSENQARMTAGSVTPGRYETFHLSCAGPPRHGAEVELRALEDDATIGIDPQGHLQAGRAPHLLLTFEKVGGRPGKGIEDGDTVALRKPGPGWWPLKRYVRAIGPEGALQFTSGSRNSDAEFVFHKAREITKIDLPAAGSSEGVLTLRAEAPAGGVPIELTSSHPDAVEVQKIVLVETGQRDAKFRCVIHAERLQQEAVITAMSIATHDMVSVKVPSSAKQGALPSM